jgi:hypothetical protein
MDRDPITKSLFRALLPKMCHHNYAAGLLTKGAGSGMGLRTERDKQLLKEMGSDAAES